MCVQAADMSSLWALQHCQISDRSHLDLVLLQVLLWTLSHHLLCMPDVPGLLMELSVQLNGVRVCQAATSI